MINDDNFDVGVFGDDLMFFMTGHWLVLADMFTQGAARWSYWRQSGKTPCIPLVSVIAMLIADPLNLFNILISSEWASQVPQPTCLWGGEPISEWAW